MLLISPPWRLANWPSLAIATLKARLGTAGIRADCSHLHADVARRFGAERYHRISWGWEVGEALSFALAYPDEADLLLERSRAAAEAGGRPETMELCNRAVLRDLQDSFEGAVEALDLGRYTMVGLSVGALQLGASIYVAKLARSLNPAIRIVAGGSALVGMSGAALLEKVPEIDVVVDGEGETALAMLAGSEDWKPGHLARIPRLWYRDEAGGCVRSAGSDVTELARTRPPDFDEYFNSMEGSDSAPFATVIPVEGSRGCAWEHRRGDGVLRGCTFCGLYRGSPNYRDKPMEAVIEELDRAAYRYGSLEISFTDAYLPASWGRGVLRWMSEHVADFTLFCELRCDLDEEVARLLAEAGARQVQLGVEALNSSVLRKIGKGTRLADNVQSIKLCREHGIEPQYNLITHYPGVTAEELEETLELLPSLFGLPPPTVAEFYLDRGSLIFQAPERFGLDGASFDRTRHSFLPARFEGTPISQVVTFERIESEEVARGWSRLEAMVERWQALWREWRAAGIDEPLSYRDTGKALVVIDRRAPEALVVTLEGPMRDLLLAARTATPRRRLLALLPGADEEMLESGLSSLRRHRLILQDKETVLALPLRARLPGGRIRSHPADAVFA
jgi:ribosomal peptide maturation radical SAM protein 1